MSICHAFLFFSTYSISAIACFIIEAPFFYTRHAREKTAMLESEGLQTRSSQKIQMLVDNKPSPFFIDTAPAQRNPTPTDNKLIPVAKELVRSSPAKECQLTSR